jgi:phage gp29-like protein
VTTNGASTLADAFGRAEAPKDDIAWQPPRAATAEEIRSTAGAIAREIPLATVATGWDVPSARIAYEDLVVGLFDRPAQLVDSIDGDSRVQAAMASRVGGLLGRPVDFVLPRRFRDSDEAKECRDAFVDAWPTMAAEPVVSEIQRWAVQLGFGPAQSLWDTSGRYAIPHQRPWHPRYTYFHWLYRCYVAITMDGQVPITAGDGHWVLHAPHGEYRGWMRGSVRAIAPWWLARNYALRDWARYSERHGLPIIIAKSPAVGDPIQINNWRNSLSRLGQETVINCPQHTDARASFDVGLLETADGSWEGFAGLIRQCDTEITLALLAQNLTTEVKEGSYAAARVHADVRQALLEADARALAQTIYTQIARPFAAMNFGDPDLAPLVKWDVRPYEDGLTAVQTFTQYAMALYQLRNSGLAPRDPERLAKDFGIDLGRLEKVEPLQVASSANSKAAVAGAKEQAKQQAKLAEKTAKGVRVSREAMARAEEQLFLRFQAGASAAEIEREDNALAEAVAWAQSQTKRARR